MREDARNNNIKIFVVENRGRIKNINDNGNNKDYDCWFCGKRSHKEILLLAIHIKILQGVTTIHNPSLSSFSLSTNTGYFGKILSTHFKLHCVVYNCK